MSDNTLFIGDASIHRVVVYQPIPIFRWVIRNGWDGPEKHLQQEWREMHSGISDWRDIETVDLTHAAHKDER